jgi:hypothetical protein
MDFFSRRCFFRATPLLPGHKLAFPIPVSPCHERLLPQAQRSSSRALGATLLKTRRVGLFLFRISEGLAFSLRI